ncbi:putative reverse transcriptase domain-containing protein, partial [Tanacetum coccineum]
DPLGPLLFALILHPLLHKIKDSCKILLHAWYLDDGTVIGDSEKVAKVLDIIKVNGPGLGLELNIKKTEIFWPSCNGMKLREGLFSVDIRRPSSGVKLLRGAVSRDAYFISGLAMRRAVNAVDLMGLLSQLHDPQNHILRDCGICGMDDDYVSALVCLRDTIPSFDFSGFTNKDIVPSKAQQTLANVLLAKWSRIWKFTLTDYEIKISFECLRAPHAQDFLLAIPIDGLGQQYSSRRISHLSLVSFYSIPLFPLIAICPVVCHACVLGSHQERRPVKLFTDLSDGSSTLRRLTVGSRGFTGSGCLKPPREK